MDNIQKLYWALREKALVYFSEYRIFEFSATEESLQVISKIVSGRTFLLEPNKIIHSLILNNRGLIVDIVYVMMFDEKYWILTSKNNERSAEIILEYGNEVAVKEITGRYQLVTIEGPYSWKIMKAMVGLEILGLSYLRFMNAEFDNTEIIICRAGITGEYGYRLFVPDNIFESIMKRIDDFNEFELMKSKGIDPEFETVLKTAILETRFPVFNKLVYENESPIENELRWMIDFRKEDYTGKEAIENQKHSYTKLVVGFICEKPLENIDLGQLSRKAKIFVDGQEIGTVKDLAFSYKLNKHIGFGEFEKEWGYAGISQYHIRYNDLQIPIITASTPFFITESSNVQMG